MNDISPTFCTVFLFPIDDDSIYDEKPTLYDVALDGGLQVKIVAIYIYKNNN